MTLSYEEARKNLEFYLRVHFPKLTVDDLEITDTKGYWRIKKPCGGRVGGCTNMIHTTLFNEGPIQHTISYYDSWKSKDGRFKSIYETWRTLKEIKEETCQ
jgi:hypothetical protein